MGSTSASLARTSRPAAASPVRAGGTGTIPRASRFGSTQPVRPAVDRSVMSQNSPSIDFLFSHFSEGKHFCHVGYVEQEKPEADRVTIGRKEASLRRCAAKEDHRQVVRGPVEDWRLI